MRRLFLQREVLDIAHLLKWKKLDRKGLWWWRIKKRFPKPVFFSSKMGGLMWYAREDIEKGFMCVSEYQGYDLNIRQVKLAIREVLKTNKKVTKDLFKFRKVICE